MWLKSLASFRKRLAWRCHFIQKLEMESDLDLVAQNKIIDSNLNRVMDEERFIRWKTGTTGWPFLDACMRQLASTGWINFRMRAMIMSAASYNLWLPWRDTGCHLAKQFIDYEPGIHWSQVGMQSGTTGINTIRAYSMTKQGKDQDPMEIIFENGFLNSLWCRRNISTNPGKCRSMFKRTFLYNRHALPFTDCR